MEATAEDTEALELAHQQELQDLEDRLTDKHRKDLDNLETQYRSRIEDMGEKHRLEVERLRNELLQAQQALDQYPDIQEEVMSPVQAVPTVSVLTYKSKHLKSVSSQCAHGKSSIARKPEVHPKIFRWYKM